MESTVRAISGASKSAKLGEFAFKPGQGVLTAHIDGGEADGFQKLYESLSQSWRNFVHHDANRPVSPMEAIQVLGAINLMLTITRKLGHEAYLAPFVTKYENQYLLAVKHVPLDGDREGRIVSYAEGWAPSPKGKLLVAVREGDVWRRVPGGLEASKGFLSGELLEGRCARDAQVTRFVRFATPVSPAGVINFEILAFHVTGDALTSIASPLKPAS
jgi:hypothetical protein